MLKGFKGKNVLRVSVALGLLLAIVVPASVSAANNNDYDYAFYIHSYHDNTRVGDNGSRYRSTKDPENSWKVKMTYSNEPGDSKTITRYWIEGESGENVAASVNVLEDDPAYYNQAYDSASERRVYLTAENNNYSSNTYGVGGIWDEETGVYVR